MSETLATTSRPTGAAASRIARNTLKLAVGDATSKAAVFVLYIVIAHSLGRSGFGDYTLAISLAFFVRVSSLGADVILSREVARHTDRVHGLFWHTIALKLLVGVPVVAGITAFAILTGEPAGIVACVALIGLSNAIDVIAFSVHATLRGREHMGPPARALALESGLIAVLGAVLLIALNGTLAGLGVVYVVAALCGLAYITVAMLRRGIRPRLRGGEHGPRWLLSASLATGIANFFSLALGRLDAVILSLITGSSVTVGLYGGAYRVFETTLLVNSAFGLAIFPILSRLERRSHSLRNAFELAGAVVSALTMPVFGVMVFFGGLVLHALLGSGFGEAGTALGILGGATFLSGLFTVAALTVAGQDRQRTLPWVAGAALAVNVALNLALIPSRGIEGAAIAMTAAQVVITGLIAWVAVRQTGGASWPRMLAAPTAGFAAMAGVAVGLGSGAAALVASLAAYGVALVVAERLLFPQDAALVAGALRRRSRPGRPAAATRGLRPRRLRPPAGALSGLLAIGLGGLLAGALAVAGSVTTPLVPLVALAGLGLVLLALRRPVVVAYLAVLLIPLETLSTQGAGFGLTPTEFLTLAAAAGWLLQRLARGGPSLRSPMTLPIAALLAAHIPGLFLAADRFAVVKELSMWTACFVVFLMLVAEERPRTTETLTRVIAASAALVALLALVKSAGSHQVAIDFGGSVTDRATGSFQSPVLLAIFVAMTLPLQLALAVRGRTRATRLLGGVGALAVVAAMALALTRSAFVGLSIALVWLIVAWRPARRVGLGVALVLGVLLLTRFNPAPTVFDTNVIVQRISTISSPSTHTVQLRLQLWRAAPQILSDHLPFGIGAKNLPKVAADYGLVFPAGAPSNVHDTLLVVATEFGIPGLLALAWFVVALTRTLLGALRARSEPQHALAIALTAGFLAIAVDGITDYGYGDNAYFLAFLLLVAAAVRLHREASVATAPEAVGPVRHMTPADAGPSARPAPALPAGVGTS